LIDFLIAAVGARALFRRAMGVAVGSSADMIPVTQFTKKKVPIGDRNFSLKKMMKLNAIVRDWQKKG